MDTEPFATRDLSDTHGIIERAEDFRLGERGLIFVEFFDRARRGVARVLEWRVQGRSVLRLV